MNTAGAAAAILLAYLVAILREAEYSEFHCEPSTWSNYKVDINILGCELIQDFIWPKCSSNIHNVHAAHQVVY